MKFENRKVIRVDDFNKFVKGTYGRPYNFQQQDGCKPRGTFHFKVPDIAEDYENDTITINGNSEDMGVSFKSWLATEPRRYISMLWERNFYPDVQMIVNDLHNKGLLEAGEYYIEIDW